MQPARNLHKSCYLKPGEVLFTAEPSLVTTVLGSCISVTMHHRATRLSAICHAVMPGLSEAREKKRENRFQYVDSSLAWMIEQYAAERIRTRDIEVKMFGGAAMFTGSKSTGLDMNIGRKNIDTALALLERLRIPLSAWNVGGSQGRKLIFNTMTGEVLAKFITKAEASLIDSGGKK